MKTNWIASLSLGLTLLGLAAEARADLLTIEQATELSQTTGRPIFAVAGSKT
jgi:hypothetical protein